METHYTGAAPPCLDSSVLLTLIYVFSTQDTTFECNRGGRQNLRADLLRPSLLGPTLTGYGVAPMNPQLYGKVCTDLITTQYGLGEVAIGSVKHWLTTIHSTNVRLFCYLTGYNVAFHQALGISATNYFPTCTSPSVELAVLPGLGVPHRCSC